MTPKTPPHWLGLEDRVCVVTGAASGIGAAIASSLARVGARVALLDRDLAGAQRVASEITPQAEDVLAVHCDIADEDSVQAAADRVRAELGSCHALINNAGLALGLFAGAAALTLAFVVHAIAPEGRWQSVGWFAAYAPWVMRELRLHQLYATVLAFNIGSARVLRRNGFLEEGVQRAAVCKRGVLHDLRMFAKVRRSLDDE